MQKDTEKLDGMEEEEMDDEDGEDLIIITHPSTARENDDAEGEEDEEDNYEEEEREIGDSEGQDQSFKMNSVGEDLSPIMRRHDKNQPKELKLEPDGEKRGINDGDGSRRAVEMVMQEWGERMAALETRVHVLEGANASLTNHNR